MFNTEVMINTYGCSYAYHSRILDFEFLNNSFVKIDAYH